MSNRGPTVPTLLGRMPAPVGRQAVMPPGMAVQPPPRGPFPTGRGPHWQRINRPTQMRMADGSIVSLRQPTPQEAHDIRRATRIIKVPDYPTLSAATGSTPFVGPDVQLEFLDSGWIVAAAFDIKNEGASLGRSSVGVRLTTVGQGSAITTDTKTAAFVPITLINPQIGIGGIDLGPFVRHVIPNDKLNIAFQNQNLSTPWTPTGAFWWVADADVPEGVRPDPVGSSLPACTRFVLVPDQANPGAPLAASTIGDDGIVTWQYDGLVNAFRSDVLADNGDGRASFAVLIENWGQDRDAITTDGKASAYVTSTLLSAGPEQALRILRRVEISDQTRVSFQNTNGALSGSPCGVFFLDADRDVMTRSLYEA
jgi:hypothetical protein